MLGKFFQKPGEELAERVPPGQHLAKGFPVLTYGDTPQVSQSSWQFRVWGLVKEDKTFNWNDFMAMPQTAFTADFHCVTTWSKLDVEWTGVRVVDFMRHLEVDPEAVHVMEHCYGGYTTNLMLDVLQDETVMLCHSWEGKPLTAEHGGPCRLLVPKRYAWKSAKWVKGFQFLAKDKPGLWEDFGYSMTANPWKEERYSE